MLDGFLLKSCSRERFSSCAVAICGRGCTSKLLFEPSQILISLFHYHLYFEYIPDLVCDQNSSITSQSLHCGCRLQQSSLPLSLEGVLILHLAAPLAVDSFYGKSLNQNSFPFYIATWNALLDFFSKLISNSSVHLVKNMIKSMSSLEENTTILLLRLKLLSL